MSKILKILVAWFFLAVLAFFYFKSQLSQWAKTPISISEKLEFDLNKGTSLNALSRSLYSEGIVDSSFKFKWATKLLYNYHKFQAGHYMIENGDSPEILSKSLSRENHIHLLFLR